MYSRLIQARALVKLCCLILSGYRMEEGSNLIDYSIYSNIYICNIQPCEL